MMRGALLPLLLGTALGTSCASTPPPSKPASGHAATTAGDEVQAEKLAAKKTAPRALSVQEEEELAALLTRALISDEESKSRAQDEGRYRELVDKLTFDLIPAEQRGAAQCAQLQLQARGLLQSLRGLREEQRAHLQEAGKPLVGATASLADFIASVAKRESAYRLQSVDDRLVLPAADTVVARAIGDDKSMAAGDSWVLLADGSMLNEHNACPPPLDAKTRGSIARQADRRLMDVMRRRAPDVAAVMEQNQIIRRCRKLSDIARLRLRAFFVSQELFFAEHGRYALLSELPPEALPATRETAFFQFDLVKADANGFLYRATGRGDTHAAGTLWEIDQMGVAHAVMENCGQRR